jgi:hypothetical protein
MVRKVSSELVPLTRELALQFSQMAKLPGERPLRASRVKYFEAELQGGTFNSPNWAKAIIDGHEGEWRADGQHTSHLLATCDEKLFPKDDLSVTINTYRLNSLGDLGELFDLFDNPLSARTNADKMGIYIADYAELDQLDRTFLGRTARGIDYFFRDLLKEGQKAKVFDSREHGLYFDDGVNRAFAVWLYEHHQTKHAWMVGKPGIAAEIYIDWRSHPELAKVFWAEVFTESNSDPDDETRMLASTLRDWSRKQPRVTQDRFRARAKKAFDRYRRLTVGRSKEAAREDEVIEIPPGTASGGYELHA